MPPIAIVLNLLVWEMTAILAATRRFLPVQERDWLGQINESFRGCLRNQYLYLADEIQFNHG
jgi:hypothetical protein